MGSLWPLGLRGKAIRLLNDADLDVRDPLAGEIAEMLIMSAKRLRSQAGTRVDEWSLIVAAAIVLPDNETALPHLSSISGITREAAFSAMTKVAYQALRKRAEIGGA